MFFRNNTELSKDWSKWRQASRCNLYITRDICLFSDILHRIYGMFEFKERLNFICFLKDNDLKVKHISLKFRHFKACLAVYRDQGSGISGTEGTVVAGLLPTSLFTDPETFLMNLRVVSDDYKIHPSGSTI